MFTRNQYRPIKTLYAHSLDIRTEEFQMTKQPLSEKETPMDPSVWGPAFWLFIHISTRNYPEKASPICKEQMKQFIIGLPCALPCKVCSEHARAFIESNYEHLDGVVSGRDVLFKFFVDFHNKVNRRYNKPIMSYEDAYALYSSPSQLKKISYK